jgi:hypothetical protein
MNSRHAVMHHFLHKSHDPWKLYTDYIRNWLSISSVSILLDGLDEFSLLYVIIVHLTLNDNQSTVLIFCQVYFHPRFFCFVLILIFVLFTHLFVVYTCHCIVLSILSLIFYLSNMHYLRKFQDTKEVIRRQYNTMTKRYQRGNQKTIQYNDQKIPKG